MASVDTTLAWSNSLSNVLTAIVSVTITWFIAKGGSLSGASGSIPVGPVALLRDTLVYMPHALLLFGVLADMLTYEGVYSIASLVGLVSLLFHGLFKTFWAGAFSILSKLGTVATVETTQASPTTAPRPTTGPRPGSVAAQTAGAEKGSFFGTYTGCDVQGFDWAHSPYAPQTLVVIAAIFSYYLFDLVTNRGWVNSTATIVLGAVVYLAQLVLSGDCSLPGEEQVSKGTQAFLGLIEGTFWGGLSYGVVQTYFPQSLPSSAISPFPKTTPNMLKDGKFDKDGNPWVCVGGNCYPDMSSADARKKFAGIAAASTGNGRAAVAEDCPAA